MKSNKIENFDHNFKLIIIGDSGVGKTNLLLRCCEDKFIPSYMTTIGIDFKVKNLDLDGRKIRLQLWDTAGQDRFKTITQNYYKGAEGIIMSYSIADRNSFSNIDSWMKQVKDHASENVCIMLVGTKCDLPNRVIETSEAKKMAESYGISFIETSAKSNINIQEAFEIIAKEIKEKKLKNQSDIQFHDYKSLYNKNNENVINEGCNC